MQPLAWDDLRYLLAAHRAGSYAAAARRLGVDDTTVSRRLRALQRIAGAELLMRRPDGTLRLTPAGEAVAVRAKRMEGHARAIGEALGRAAGSALGTVRVTAVPIVAHRMLVPALPELLDAHPGLAVELVPEARDLSLTRREADLAIRLARPVAGGSHVTARRIGTLAYGAFAAAGLGEAEASTLPWITHDDATAHLPPARWLARAARADSAAGLRVACAETALKAATQGVGRALLPLVAGGRDPRLRAVGPGGLPPPPGREVWLLAHAEQRDLAAVRATTGWIASLGWSKA